MRRISIALLCCLCLSACAKKSDLPPEEVLRRSAQNIDKLQAAHFTAHANVATPDGTQFTLDADGVLSSGGKQFQFTIALNGSYNAKGVSHTVDAQADVAVAGQRDVFFRLRSLSIAPSQDAISQQTIDSILNQWWKLPVDESASTSDISPDPQLLRLQASVMRVLEDKGIESVSGSDAYHYRVSLDAEKFLAFLQASAAKRGESYDSATATAAVQLFSGVGDLWIDRETMFMRKIDWQFGSKEQQRPVSIRISASLSDYNHVQLPPFPQDAKPWELGALLTPSVMQKNAAQTSSSLSGLRSSAESHSARSVSPKQ